MNDILEITPPKFPIDLDAKVFQSHDEDGNPIGEKYSYNDFVKQIEDISGVSKELLGMPNEDS